MKKVSNSTKPVLVGAAPSFVEAWSFEENSWGYQVCTVDMHCPKSNPNFRDITGSEVENMVLHELFRLVSRFPLGQCARFGLVVTVASPPGAGSRLGWCHWPWCCRPLITWTPGDSWIWVSSVPPPGTWAGINSVFQLTYLFYLNDCRVMNIEKQNNNVLNMLYVTAYKLSNYEISYRSNFKSYSSL